MFCVRQGWFRRDTMNILWNRLKLISTHSNLLTAILLLGNSEHNTLYLFREMFCCLDEKCLWNVECRISLLYKYLDKISLLYNTLSKDSVSAQIRACWDTADLGWWEVSYVKRIEKVSTGSETWDPPNMVTRYEAIQKWLRTNNVFIWDGIVFALDNQWEFSYTELLRINVKYPNFPDRTHFLVGIAIVWHQ